MKKAITIVLTLCSSAVFGQEFSFQMFFQDAIGNKDTLTVGYDLTASDSIDAIFGEQNIIGVPIDTGLDVRISNELENRSYYKKPGSYHTKKQISFYDCPKPWTIYTQTVDVHTKHWPVSVSWDKSLFVDSCRAGSVFTSIHPGGWWDTSSDSDLGRQVLRLVDNATFTSNQQGGFNENYGYIKDNDTIPVYWMAFGDLNLLKSSVPNINDINNEVKSFPNPFSSQLNIETKFEKQASIELLNVYGQTLLNQYFTKKTSLNTSDLPKGVYFYKLIDADGFQYTGKTIKE